MYNITLSLPFSLSFSYIKKNGKDMIGCKERSVVLSEPQLN